MIKGRSRKFRIPLTKKLRTGYMKAGTNSTYPSDTDVFVAKKSDGWSTEDLQIFEGKPIGGAKFEKPDEAPYDIGKAVRGMLPVEFDAMDEDGHELAVELLNRSWAHSKLRCSGTGGDEAGDAICRDETYMRKIVKATKQPEKMLDEGRWAVKCLGPKCPLWHANKKNEPLAGCHAELRLHFILLHPTTNPEDPNYMKQLGWVGLTSGSINAMLDIQSGFAAMRGLTNALPGSSPEGRTALIPFTLKRVPRTLMPEGKRVVKSTLMVDFDTDEVLRFGYGPAARALIRPQARRELLELARAEAEYDSFRDIVPRPELGAARLGLPARSVGEPEGADYPLAGAPTGTDGGEAVSGTSLDSPKPGVAVSDSPPSAAGDRDQAVATAVDQASTLTEADLNKLLSQHDRDELKKLCGGIPGDSDSLARFRGLVERAYANFDETNGGFTGLRMRHQLWIRDALATEPAAVEDPE